MQDKEVSSIHGYSKRKFLLSIDAGKGNFCYLCMHKGKFLLSQFCYGQQKYFIKYNSKKKKKGRTGHCL